MFAFLFCYFFFLTMYLLPSPSRCTRPAQPSFFACRMNMHATTTAATVSSTAQEFKCSRKKNSGTCLRSISNAMMLIMMTVMQQSYVSTAAPVASTTPDGSWTLLHSSYLDSYKDAVDCTISEKGTFTTSDDYKISYQQVYLECGSTNGVSVQRVITLENALETAGTRSAGSVGTLS